MIVYLSKQRNATKQIIEKSEKHSTNLEKYGLPHSEKCIKMVEKESSSSSEDEDIDFEELMVTKLALANTENQKKGT